MHLYLFLFPLQHMKRPALQNKQVTVLRMVFRVRKVLGTFEKRAQGRIHELETQEISQKTLSDALSSQWVDNLIANMPTNGTRGHIRELRNHLFRWCVKPKKPRITTLRFNLNSLYSLESMKFNSLSLVFITSNTMTIQFALAL